MDTACSVARDVFQTGERPAEPIAKCMRKAYEAFEPRPAEAVSVKS